MPFITRRKEKMSKRKFPAFKGKDIYIHLKNQRVNTLMKSQT